MKSILYVFLLLLTGSCLYAQDQPGGGQGPGGDGRRMDPVKRAEQQTVLMTEKLGLSEAQSAKISEINLKYAQKMKELREANPEGDRAALREKMMALRVEQDAELKSMMTSDQWAEWEKVRQEFRPQKREKGN